MPLQATVLDLTQQLSGLRRQLSERSSVPSSSAAAASVGQMALPRGLRDGHLPCRGSDGGGDDGDAATLGAGGGQTGRNPSELRAVEMRVEEQQRTISQLCGEISK